MSWSPEELEAVAAEAARLAGRVLRRRFLDDQPEQVERKGLHDFVTEADRAAERVVIGHLEKCTPGIDIMSEEAAPETRSRGLMWVIDPLDGTTNFIHGVPVFAVSIALEDGDGPLAAAVFDPIRDELFRAHRGGGAFVNDRPMRCNEPDGTQNALIATGFPFRELSRVKPYLAAFEAFIRTTAGLRRAGSASIDLAYTACGRYDGFWEIGLSRWDIAAGVLLVQEAGGRVTDATGGDRYLETGDIVAGAPRLHEMMLGVMRDSFG